MTRDALMTSLLPRMSKRRGTRFCLSSAANVKVLKVTAEKTYEVGPVNL